MGKKARSREKMDRGKNSDKDLKEEKWVDRLRRMGGTPICDDFNIA